MTFDLIIIGGGAAGLAAAVMAKSEYNSVLILEHTDRVGKKILSTGNGRCNLTNMNCTPERLHENPEGMFPYFTSGSGDFAESVIARFDADDTVHFFASLGLLTEDKNGYVYPRSEQASTVLDVLRNACARKGVEIETGVQVKNIKKTGEDIFAVDDRFFCRNLLIAAGGMSAPKTGSDGSGYELAAGFGHSVVKPVPALCGIRCSDKFFKELAGVRNDSVITLTCEISGRHRKNKTDAAALGTETEGKLREAGNLKKSCENNSAAAVSGKETEGTLKAAGNLQFTSYGISGIPAFQISSETGRMLERGQTPVICIDLLPELNEEELAGFIDESGDRTLHGVLNKKLANVICKEIEKAKDRLPGKTFGQQAAAVIKSFRVNPVALNSFEEAQTTAGGIPTDEIDPETMESKLVPGLYFAGEIMDVNGICGGYNLQWAWSSAYIAAEAVNHRTP